MFLIRGCGFGPEVVGEVEEEKGEGKKKKGWVGRFLGKI